MVGKARKRHGWKISGPSHQGPLENFSDFQIERKARKNEELLI